MLDVDGWKYQFNVKSTQWGSFNDPIACYIDL